MSRTLYLVDDDEACRRDLIGRLGGLDLETWPFAAAAQFAALLPQLQPAPVLLSMELVPDGAGLAILDEMAAGGRAWPVVAYGGDADMRIAVEAMKRGAIDYLILPVASAPLAEAAADALAMLDRSVDAQSAREGVQERLAALTARETEVLRALTGGMGNKTAAHGLGLSVRTVEMHRSRLLRKLGVKSLAEAAVLVAHADFAPAASIFRARRIAAARERGLRGRA